MCVFVCLCTCGVCVCVHAGLKRKLYIFAEGPVNGSEEVQVMQK